MACPTLLVHGAHDLIVSLEHACRIAAAIPGAELVVIEGGGHRPDIRDPVMINVLVDRFLGEGERPRKRMVARAAARTRRRALYVSSPIGLGHVRRDLAIAHELRERCPDLEIEWLAQAPSVAVLEAAGETIHPASAQLSGEVEHIESYAEDHRLPVFRAWRDMDEILATNFMVFADAVRLAVGFVRLPAGADLRPATKGLPHDLCPCPHWGYMLKGRVRMHTIDGHQDFAAG